ncbi:hypothetical protein BQ8420_08105 [Nocardiopsis sp. JB363]|nr:hypothetical protein BQ8420_08105 [Nocardiopsis sp. JB363]
MHRTETVSVEPGGIADPQGGGCCSGHGKESDTGHRKKQASVIVSGSSRSGQLSDEMAGTGRDHSVTEGVLREKGPVF